MQNQDLFSLKDKSKKLKCRLLQVLFGALRVKVSIPYFLGYMTDFFSFQNNPKDLDPSYKTDLDL